VGQHICRHGGKILKIKHIIIIVFVLIQLGMATTMINESDDVYWFQTGNDLYNASEYNEAIEAYDMAIELNQSYAEAWNNKGSALSDLGKYSEAEKAYRKAVEITPNYAQAWYNIGTIQKRLGKYNESIKLGPRNVTLRYVKGSIYSDHGEFNEAIPALGPLNCTALDAISMSYYLDLSNYRILPFTNFTIYAKERGVNLSQIGTKRVCIWR
jgi:tetratricopeptide (TPR) repeat protein